MKTYDNPSTQIQRAELLKQVTDAAYGPGLKVLRDILGLKVLRDILMELDAAEKAVNSLTHDRDAWRSRYERAQKEIDFHRLQVSQSKGWGLGRPGGLD